MALTRAEKRDLREAWSKIHEASEKLAQQFPYDATLPIRQTLSDATRLIDRVEQGRSH